MPYRFILLDSLESLSKGNLLVRFSTISCTQHLEGVPLVSLVSDRLVRDGLVEPYQMPIYDLINHSSTIYYKLSHDGERVYREGMWRYSKMTFRDKVLGRLGII